MNINSIVQMHSGDLILPYVALLTETHTRFSRYSDRNLSKSTTLVASAYQLVRILTRSLC